MSKYYVGCGSLKHIVLSNSPRFAAITSLLELAGPDVTLYHELRVSEKGHTHHVDDFIFDTYTIMVEAGFEFED